jgi:hypothetical protein
MQYPSLKSLALPAFAAAVILFSPVGFAATISNVVYTNTSRPDSVEDGVAGVHSQFRSSGSVGSVITNGNSASVTATTQWVGGYKVATAGPAHLLFIYPSLSLSFTVDDPANIGYTLDATSLTRGYLSALYESGSDFSLAITAAGTNLGFSFDSGSGPTSIFQLITFGDNIAANKANPSVSKVVSSSKSANLGNFSGTRTFSFVLSWEPSPAGTMVFQNPEVGQAAVVFGMSSTLDPLTLSKYPSAQAAAADGNFLTVTATFNQSGSEVPEPTTTVLLGLGLVAMGAVARHQRKGIRRY